MGLFHRKVKVEYTDEQRQRQDFIKDKQKNPPSTQNCYRLYMRYHRPGDSPFRSNLIYFIYKGKLQSIPRG